MFLKHLVINNFKNIAHAELIFSPKINCITGNNGEGKTNLLDAVYYLSMTKSFFHYPDMFSIKHNEQFTVLHGNYEMSDNTINKIALSFTKHSKNESAKENINTKILKKNDKVYKKFSEHIGKFPIVMVSPADISLVVSGAEERRRFINQLISQIDNEYLLNVQNYNKLLIQRNKYLKEENISEDFLEVLNLKLSECAKFIYCKRAEMVKLLNESVSEYYNNISGGREKVNIKYISDLDKGDLLSLLKKSFHRDKELRFTTLGVHKDDFLFEQSDIDNIFTPIKRCASQGQQKCFLISLKLAQYNIIKRLNGGIAPILLLDDIFDKLDMNRVEFLLSMVSGDNFGQIFITDSNKVRMNTLIDKVGGECKDFNVKEGVIE